MAVHSIKMLQKIPGALPDIWAFFSNPQNLATITPASLQFNVISKHHGGTIYPGQIIEYKVSPVLHIPLYWMTEITHVAPNKYFIDEQRFGREGIEQIPTVEPGRSGIQEVLFRVIGGARRIEIRAGHVLRVPAADDGGGQPIIDSNKQHRQRTSTRLPHGGKAPRIGQRMSGQIIQAADGVPNLEACTCIS